ncbi:integrator complex subunit 13 isoform X2 [Plodia interpunctella]|uniref:integrator complex subunit 13 isoform X2 n=1 Tax=Plodia interpunctella TaxID=58824 RepID=UPI002368428C|nr:integrator complex subunit 13 isoform X2 [Plodia interpunctella]
MFPTNHKTIFVLDHTPYFGISSDYPIDFDSSKSRGPGYVPLPPVCKSLWTCSVEAAVEYCRIVWDLFPEGKLVRFVVSDSVAHILNTWAVSQQNLTHILNGLCLVGPVRRGAGGDVVGLCAAIESLGEPSPTQSSRPASEHFQNRGRVICITSARDDDSIRSLAEIALNALLQQNKKASIITTTPASPDASNSPQPLVVHYCHLVIINVTPEKAETRVNNQPITEMGGGLMGVEVRVTRASELANLLAKLVLPHYRLATTTVTGIPMKEEQNASSSANYDVEIIHSAEAHAGLRAAQTAAEAAESVVLRWWTPRGAEGGAGGCSGPLWRVTPADVASRPSACLVNFLLNGRSVTLELPRKGGGRSASHVLAAQGGELWIGALGGRTPYDDPPALSEGAGGRVTDYRIKEFGALMQQNKLHPLRGAGANARARARLQRHTTYWPLTISSTLIFNLGSVMEPLTRLVVQESLTDDEVDTCRNVLLSLVGMESRHEFPSSQLSSNMRGKSSARREEQWRQVWAELEALVRAHAAAPAHRALLRVLLDCRAHNNHADDSPLSPVGSGAGAGAGDVWAPRNVLDALLGPPRPPRRPDFAGRMAAGTRPATLYTHLQQDVEPQH